MNGIHDLGGMHGFGPVEREENEPVFHAPWERVMVAIQRTGTVQGIFTIDEFRHGIERMDPAHYLASSYYEHWLDGFTRLMLEKGVLSEQELAARTAFFADRPDAPATAALSGPLPATRPRASLDLRSSARPSDWEPRFRPGDRVRTREMNPPGHTRLARYARDKRGVVERYRGTHVFPDASAHGLGEQPQPLYSVRFEARELWGESAEPNQSVNIDLWESYLLPG